MRLSLLPDTLQLPPTTPPTTPIYKFSLLLRPTEPTTDYLGGSAYQVNYYYYRHYRGPSAFRAENFEKYHFENC
jgi:hypothetical protein